MIDIIKTALVGLGICVTFFAALSWAAAQEQQRDSINELELVKFNGCWYVLWHNSYGSDMEHHEGCTNTVHLR